MNTVRMFVAMLSVCSMSSAMDRKTAPEMTAQKRAEIVSECVAQRSWCHLVDELAAGKIRVSDLSAYTKETFDQPREGSELNLDYGKSLFQVAVYCAGVSHQKDARYKKVLEALMVAKKITHNEGLVNTAIPVGAIGEKTDKQVMQEVYDSMFDVIRCNHEAVEPHIKNKRWQALARSARDLKLDEIYFLHLSQEQKKHLAQALLQRKSDKEFCTTLAQHLDPACIIYDTSKKSPLFSFKQQYAILVVGIIVLIGGFLGYCYYNSPFAGKDDEVDSQEGQNTLQEELTQG